MRNFKKCLAIVLSLIIVFSAVSVINNFSVFASADEFRTQHMEVDFSKYNITNGYNGSSFTNDGNTRFRATDGINFEIAGDSDKYLHFSVTGSFPKRFYLSDRAIIMNPTGGLDADTSYTIEKGGKYRLTFDYQVSKDADATGPVYAIVYLNNRYPITNNTVVLYDKDNNYEQMPCVLAKIELDSATVSSNKDGWYKASVEFEPSDDYYNDNLISSLAIAFLTSKTTEVASGAYDANANFAYDVKLDNVVADRLSSVTLHYDNNTATDTETTLYGVPASTTDNMYLKSDGTTTNTDVYSVISGEKIELSSYYLWYTDANYTSQVSDIESTYFTPNNVDYYGVEDTSVFRTQHMEVDFSKYVVNNTKNSGNTRFGAASDGVNITIDGDSDKYMHFSVSNEYLKRYYYSDRSAIINPIGGTTADTSYPIVEGAKYRVTFDYQVSKADGTGPVYIMVYSNTSYAITSSSVGTSTVPLAKIELNSATASTQKDGWYTVTAEFTGPTATEKSSLAFSFLTSKTDQASGATANNTDNFPYQIMIDNVVADRLGSAVLNYDNSTQTTVYGAPVSTNDNMCLKSDGTPNTDVYSIASAEKVALSSYYSWYNDAEYTSPVNNAYYSTRSINYYGIEDMSLFRTQHMEVDFSKYVVNNTKNSGNTRFGAANDGVNISIDGDSDKYLHFSVSDEYLIRYYYCDRTALINPTGGTTADTSYPIDEGAKYRVTFDYQVSKAAGTGDVYVMVFSNTSYAVTNTSVTKDTPQLAKITLDSATASTNKDGWYTATAEFTGPTATAKSSLGFAFLNPIQNYEGSGATSYDSTTHNFPYDIKVDNVVVDRLGTAVLHYNNDTQDEIYGAPESTIENMRLKSDGVTPNTDVYSIASAEKITFPSESIWYKNAEHTTPIGDEHYSIKAMDYYGTADPNAFKTEHMDVDFSKYSILNGNDSKGTTSVTETTNGKGNTRFGVTTDGISFSIDGDSDKYLKFLISQDDATGDTFRYHYSDRSIIMNPTGGTTSDTSYAIEKDVRYRVSFDYQVTKASGTGDVFVNVWSNASNYITANSIGNRENNVVTEQPLAKIKLDSTIKSTNKDGWYTVSVDFERPSSSTAEVSSLAFSFLTSIVMDGSANKPAISLENNFPYEIKVDNVVVDRLGSISFVYPNGNVDTSFGVPQATSSNKSSESAAYTTSTVSDSRTFPLGNYKWYSDETRQTSVNTENANYSSRHSWYYANSTRRYDTNNDDGIDICDLVATDDYINDNSQFINKDVLATGESFNQEYISTQRKYLLGIGVDEENPFEAYDLQLAFQDDFNDASLNTEYWTSYNAYSTHISSKRTPDEQYLQNGYLNLEISKLIEPWTEEIDGETYSGYFRTGSIYSKQKFGYGYYEASYKYPIGTTDECNCSFWLYNSSKDEIDINEGRMPNLTSSNVHIKGNDTGTVKKYHDGVNFSDDFHRFGLLWTENCLKWYVDGVCVRTQDTSNLSLTEESDMTIRLSLALMKLDENIISEYPVNSETYGVYAEEFDELAGQTMQVDYVRYYAIQ